MYAINGITGRVGGGVGRTLLDAGLAVRAVVRSAAKGTAWKDRGCEVAVADMNDTVALTAAFAGTEGVFVLIPPTFDPTPGFPEVKAIIAALTTAITAARPPKVVCLSTIGAQAKQTNLLSQLGLAEKALSALPMPVCLLRAAWFMENASWDVTPARDTGVISSFLQPVDRAFPMVATADIGRVAAELLQETWSGRRIVELEGPARVTPNQMADIFSNLFDRPVRAEAVPRETWEPLFTSQGMVHPLPRMQMLDGFNQGWIKFEQDETQVRKGSTGVGEVLNNLAAGIERDD